MKLSRAFFAFFLFGEEVAGPTPNTVTTYKDSDISTLDLAQPQLQWRASFVGIGKGIYATTTMQAAWASEIESALGWLMLLTDVPAKLGEISAYAAAYDAHWSKRRRSLAVEIEQILGLEYVLRTSGYEFDYVNDDPALTARYFMKNVWKGDKTGRDYTMLKFEDGTGQLHIPSATSGNSTGSLQKRSTGKGVKVAFDIGSARVTLKKHALGAAEAISKSWLKYAKEGYTNMYAFVEKVATSVLYFRTLVEMEGFGTNYENVNSCGALSEYLGTYLGSD
ncbi:hypothetical protein N7520_008277 [Penicillium odoratum]|uniref:uncharacterized protein n=1 Tax=Penicillium odoratum TaxID=1167516 RepID=UPI002548AA39|nr:uncharacterized protein N7520_008277 [Penicillium odoratum]KAJ5761121.1 hypothetical protein N7520_008277 [Penicillium odoratum]